MCLFLCFLVYPNVSMQLPALAAIAQTSPCHPASPPPGWTISHQLGTKGNTVYFRLILLDVLSEQQEKKVIH